MTSAPPPRLPSPLVQALCAHLEAHDRVLVCGDEALAADLRAAGIDIPAVDAPAPGPFDVAIVVAAPDVDPRAGTAQEEIRQRLRPGAAVLWVVPNARGRRAVRQLLHLPEAGDPAIPADAHEAGDPAIAAGAHEAATVARVESWGACVEGIDDVGDAAQESLTPILQAVRSLDGDAEALARDWAVSHRLVRARLPRQRAPRDDAARGAVRDAVQSAVDAGAIVGGRARSADGEAAAAGDGPDDAAAPRVSIVIPVHNGAELTEACLYGIAQHSGDPERVAEDPDYEVIVVDNGSDDWTMYLLHAMEGDLRVVNNDRNLGFARACNQGAGAARGEYVLFLNNDTVPHDDWLRAMVAAADADAGIGIVGARLLYPDGTIQHAGLHLVDGIPDHELRGVPGDDERVCRSRELDMVTGACLLIRRQLFEELGGFDAQFINGVEDVDLCLRARDAGWRVLYCADAVVDHHEGRTQGRFDHVQENVRRFVERWDGRFGADGRLVVDGTNAGAAGVAETPPAPGADKGLRLSGAMTAPAMDTGAAPAMDTKPASVPRVQGPTPGDAPPAPVDRFAVNWEGSFFLHSSLAHVNRELVLALLADGRCDLGLLPFEPDQFGVEEDPERFAALAARMARPLEDAQVHVRHRWPPDLTRPGRGAYALMQPWEFGAVPRAWVEAVRDGSVDQVWAYTRYVRDCYVASGVAPERVAIVPAGIDPERFRPGLAPHAAVGTERGFRFLFVGGTLYRKGIDILLQAWRDAFGADDDVCLVIKDMGVNTFYRQQTAGEQIRQLQADPGCAEILHLTDDLSGADMPHLYAAAQALVHPYRGEGFGLPVAEAMACGLPVILTRGGACDDICPEALAYGVAAERRPVQLRDQEIAGQAWQLEPDPAALAAQLRRVYEDRDEAQRRGHAGSEHARTHVTWAAAAKAAVRAIDILASGQLDEAPRLTERAPAVAPPAAPSTVGVVILGGGSDDGILSTVLSDALGSYHRFQVNTATGHALGEQLEAIRGGCTERGVELLYLLTPEAWDLASSALAADLRRLREHFDEAGDLGMLSPGHVAAEGTVDTDWPEASCVLCRMSALADAGGFDMTFATSAVLANAARGLRRKGWRVAAAGDVLAEEGDADGAPLVALGEGQARAAELDAVVAMEQGDRRRDAGQVHAAVECYRTALENKADFVEAILVGADALIEARDGAGAIAMAQRLVQIDPESAFSANYCGLVSARAGDKDRARGHFRRAVELDPNLVDARVNLGVLEWDRRDLEGALEQFGEASRLDPFNRDLVCNLGLVYGQIDDTESAAQLYRGFLERHPADVEVLLLLAEVLLVRKEMTAAADTARTILDHMPEHPRARQILEEARKDRGEDEAAQG